MLIIIFTSTKPLLVLYKTSTMTLPCISYRFTFSTSLLTLCHYFASSLVRSRNFSLYASFRNSLENFVLNLTLAIAHPKGDLEIL